MDLENDIILTRLVFATENTGNGLALDSKIVKLVDAKSDFQEAFDSETSSWIDHGVAILKMRRTASIMFDNAAKVLNHTALLRNALRQQFQLANVSQCTEATVRYKSPGCSGNTILT
jgi:hypothetical protein